MDTKKTLRYNWEFGRETVAIRVSSYRNNGNLYVGLCHKEGRDWEDFGDVTINLPYQFLEPNEAFITGDFTKDMLHFIKEHKLGKVLNETGRSGYATYQKVAFDLARLAEFDPEGVAEHCRFAGIEVPKEKTTENEETKQGRGTIIYGSKDEQRNQGLSRIHVYGTGPETMCVFCSCDSYSNRNLLWNA